MGARSDVDPANILTNPDGGRYVHAPADPLGTINMRLSPALTVRPGLSWYVAACIPLMAGMAGPQGAPSMPQAIAPAAPRVPTPAVVRGLYVNRWAALSDK